jgi:hypothetical protein
VSECIYNNFFYLTQGYQTISQAIEKYCRSIEDLFEHEMFPRGGTDLQPQKQSAWLEKAKQFTNVGEKKIELFNFTPEVRTVIPSMLSKLCTYQFAFSPASNLTTSRQHASS